MDQVHEKSEEQDTRELLREVLNMQELILHRLEQLEDRVNALLKKT
jgi:hypothetical protein